MQDWQNSRLAQSVLSSSTEENAQLVLRTCMPIAEAVLRSGTPSSMDFTLHDDRHGFRVAEMSYTLLRACIEDLSAVERSMLLMASYCHDIGMSPRRGKIQHHFQWLVAGDKSNLTPSEQNEFQSWLDTNRNGLTPPVDNDRITSHGLRAADDAIAYYARSRHNDWSEAFIRDELSALSVSLYPGWIDDLVSLCRSHHEGLLELRNDKFSARYVGSPATVINLRFLAIVLRVADVLEFAPERTPAVVLKSRDIAPSSRIYWYKDHAIAFQIVDEPAQLIMSAVTPNATIHKAVLDTAAGVDAELSLAATLKQEGLLASGVVAQTVRDRYAWPWPSRLTTDIREAPGKFTYIKGSFQPNTQKLLAILSMLFIVFVTSWA